MSELNDVKNDTVIEVKDHKIRNTRCSRTLNSKGLSELFEDLTEISENAFYAVRVIQDIQKDSM